MRSPDDKLTPQEAKTYRLVLFRRTFSCFGTGLVISAIVGGLYRDRMHFIWALCAAGAILIAFGWFEYLKDFNIVGADVVELAPDYDATGASTAVATKVIRELLFAMSHKK